jgi:hypothetical protein
VTSLGMEVRFSPAGGFVAVDLVVPYSVDGAPSDIIRLGYLEHVRRRRWRATTRRGAVVGTRFERRRDAVAALYAQRFGNPDLPRRKEG